MTVDPGLRITEPTKIIIDRKSGVVYSTLSGKIGTPDLIRHIAAIRGHPDFRSFFKRTYRRN
jgi:hypothetical protein